MSTFHAAIYPVVLDDTRHDLDVDTGCTIADMIPPEVHAIVVVNNRILAPEEYDTREPIEGDYVVIRAVPTGVIVGAIAAIGAAAASSAAVSALAAGSLLAAAGWAAASIAITVVGALIQRSLVEPPESPNSPNPERLPGITGQSNRIDPFGIIDTVYGSVRVVPKLGGRPYTEVAGDDQFLRMLLVVGHGPLAFDESDIDIGDTPLSNYDDYDIEIRNGYSSDAPIKLYKNVVSEANPNVPFNIVGDQAVRTTAENTDRISIDLTAQGLGQRQSDGSGVSTIMVAYRLEYRPTGGSGWTEATVSGKSGNVRTAPTNGFPSYTFGCIGNTLDTVRFNVSANVPEGQYDVRLTRVADEQLAPVEGIDTSLAVMDMGWSAFRSFVANDGAIIQYPEPLALIALRIRASDQLNGVIDNLSVQCRSVVDVPGQGSMVSSSPAWLMRDVLIGKSAKTRVSPARVGDLSAYAAFCADRGYEFNAVVNPGDRYRVISQILSLGRGSLDTSDGLFGVIWEQAQSAKQLFTPRNSWSFSGNRRYPKVPHALRTQYLDPTTSEANEVVVYRDGYTRANATRFETLDLSYGCASEQQAIHMAQEKLREIVLRPEGFRLTTDIEYLATGRGGRVKHAHDAILIGLGSARITAIDGNDVTFDQTFEMTVGNDYGIEVRDENAQVYAVPVDNAPGINSTVTVSEPLPVSVAVGDLVAFGETTRITQDLIIKSIDVNEDRSAELELIPYAPEIYDLGQPLPDYDSNITQPIDPKRVPPVIPAITAVRYDQDVGRQTSSGSIITQIVVNYQLPSSSAPAVETVQVSYRRTDGPWRIIESGVGTSITIADVQEGSQYEIRIRSISVHGVPSPYGPSVFHNVPGVVPLPPTSVLVDEKTFSVTLTPQGSVGDTWEFWRADVPLLLSEVESNATYIATTTTLTDDGLTPDTTYYYWVREVNVYGVSEFFAVQATTKNDLSPILKGFSQELTDTQLAGTLFEPIPLINGDQPGSVNSRLGDLRTQFAAGLQGLELGFDSADPGTQRLPIGWRGGNAETGYIAPLGGGDAAYGNLATDAGDWYVAKCFRLLEQITTFSGTLDAMVDGDTAFVLARFYKENAVYLGESTTTPTTADGPIAYSFDVLNQTNYIEIVLVAAADVAYAAQIPLWFDDYDARVPIQYMQDGQLIDGSPIEEQS